MKSRLYSLGTSDFTKGAVTAVIAGVIFAIGSVVNQTGFDVFATNWSQVLTTALNAGIAALVGYLGKNFISSSDDKLLGRVQM